MIEYKVGERFPHPNNLIGVERCIAVINTAFFDVYYWIRQPSSEDIRTWRRGKMKYGLYTSMDVPFFLVDFPGQGWNLDVTLNILKVKSDDDVDRWLNEEANIVNLFLINTVTGVLEGMRMIGINKDLAEKMKDTLEAQSHRYSSAGEVDGAIEEITGKLSTEAMIRNTKMYTL